MKQLCIALLIWLALAVYASAQTGRTSMVAFFDDCAAKKENRNAYLAWVPDLWIWCYTTDDAAALGKPEVIKRCNAGFRKRYVVSGLSCNLLYDGERIVDPLIETIRRVYPPIPMTIGIFDAQTSR